MKFRASAWRLAAAAVVVAAAPLAAADPPPLDARVGSLEKQMKAVQRKVFPGGDPRYFTPDIADAPPPAVPEGTPATSALTDLTTRVAALEQQQRALTGALEEAQNKLRQLDEAFAKYRGDTDFRLNAIEHPAAAAPPAADAVPPPPAPAADRPVADRPAKPAAKPAKAAPALSVEDQWRAAYALYTAKQYDQAEAAMTDFLAANPKAARASNAQYWLGRSYDAEGRHAEAAKAFLDGYKNYPDGDRAPDSLLWLGKSLTALKKTKQACSALDELKSVYGAKLTPAVKSAAGKARGDAKCDA